MGLAVPLILSAVDKGGPPLKVMGLASEKIFVKFLDGADERMPADGFREMSIATGTQRCISFVV